MKLILLTKFKKGKVSLRLQLHLMSQLNLLFLQDLIKITKNRKSQATLNNHIHSLVQKTVTANLMKKMITITKPRNLMTTIMTTKYQENSSLS
jgi:hypothetical protein